VDEDEVPKCSYVSALELLCDKSNPKRRASLAPVRQQLEIDDPRVRKLKTDLALFERDLQSLKLSASKRHAALRKECEELKARNLKLKSLYDKMVTYSNKEGRAEGLRNEKIEFEEQYRPAGIPV